MSKKIPSNSILANNVTGKNIYQIQWRVIVKFYRAKAMGTDTPRSLLRKGKTVKKYMEC